MKKLVLLSVCLMSAAMCAAQSAPSAAPPNAAKSSNPEAACGDPAINFKVKQGTATPPPMIAGQSQIVIVDSPDRYRSRPIILIGLDGKWVGATNDGSYVALSVAPGVHHLCAQWQVSGGGGRSILAHVTANAGNAYYFRITAETFWIETSEFDTLTDPTNFFRFERVDDDEGKLLLTENLPAIFTAKKTK